MLMLTVMHFIPDSDDPPGIIDRFFEAPAAGRYLVLSHATVDHLPVEAGLASIELSKRTPTPFLPRNLADVERLFAGFDMVEPGLVWSSQWRPEHPDDALDQPERSAVYAGVGRRT